ncbi:hypothetical protein [Fervidibacillus albus]|uniref:Uncharacterized protein n=1 Tax=Fervidibacillus albus TaxID=2980026 RepID=A0A9E8LWN0_9BACI|nr:hypothetical protein [Fervidibacillus albus]WAA10926.1 hypothetical protein OE104_06325 [Fervidibacillus albus]
MPIYLSPELITPTFQIVNIVNAEEKAVGCLVTLFHGKMIYAYGILEEDGVAEEYKSIVRHYLKGLSKIGKDVELYSCLYIGCKRVKLTEDGEIGGEKPGR